VELLPEVTGELAVSIGNVVGIPWWRNTLSKNCLATSVAVAVVVLGTK
jgi:hypothetical protein